MESRKALSTTRVCTLCKSRYEDRAYTIYNRIRNYKKYLETFLGESGIQRIFIKRFYLKRDIQLIKKKVASVYQSRFIIDDMVKIVFRYKTLKSNYKFEKYQYIGIIISMTGRYVKKIY